MNMVVLGEKIAHPRDTSLFGKGALSLKLDGLEEKGQLD